MTKGSVGSDVCCLPSLRVAVPVFGFGKKVYSPRRIINDKCVVFLRDRQCQPDLGRTLCKCLTTTRYGLNNLMGLIIFGANPTLKWANSLSALV